MSITYEPSLVVILPKTAGQGAKLLAYPEHRTGGQFRSRDTIRAEMLVRAVNGDHFRRVALVHGLNRE